MASNYRKSFNFRNGVQVDNDNFVVNANGLVGIGTTVPSDYLLNVYGDTRVTGLVTTNNLHAGVGTVGVLTATTANITNVNVSGALTASSFKLGSSPEVNNLIGYAYTAWINTGGVGLHTLSSVGIGTTEKSGLILDVLGNVNVAGVLTSTRFSGIVTATDLRGTINNARLPSSISVTDVTATTFTGALTGTASTAQGLTGSPDITVTDVSASNVSASNLSATGIVTATTELNVGTGGTAVTALDSGRLGIGTTIPSSELQIRKASGSLLEVISDSGQARISIGNSVGAGNSSGVIRFGNSANDFDIINNDTGNLNYYLHAGPAGLGTGRFDWIYGQTNAELMSLTYGGSLGIGVTNPDNTLHVVGTSTVTGNSFVGGNLSVDGNISGTLTLPDVIESNINVTSGISTVFGLDVDNGADIFGNIIVSAASSIGIGTDTPITDIDAFNKILVVGAIGVGESFTNIDNKLPDIGSIYTDGQIICQGVGIGTTTVTSALSVYGNFELYPDLSGGPGAVSYVSGTKVQLAFDNQTVIGIGTTESQASVDFRLAGKGVAGGAASFMMPPQVSTTVGLDTAGKEGALVFNTTTKKFQGYTGTTWVDLH